WALAVACGVAALLVGLSALMRVIYLVGLLYGLALVAVAVYLAQLALRVDYGEPSGTVDEDNAFTFLFRRADRYPQCALMILLGLGTRAVAPVGAWLRDTAGFSSPPDGSRGGTAGADRQPKEPDTRPPVRGEDPPKAPQGEQGSAEPGLRAAWSFDEGN